MYRSFFFFSSRRRHTRLTCDWSSDVCSSDLALVTCVGTVDYVGNSSMDITVEVHAENPSSGERRHTHTAHMVFVAKIGRASVGKECRSRWSPQQQNKKNNDTDHRRLQVSYSA